MLKFILSVFLVTPVFAFAQQSNLPSERIWAVRDSLGNYTINSTESVEWKLFSGTSINSINWKSKIATWKGEPIVQSADPQNRIFYAAVHQKDTIVFSERRIPMAGTPNFRDLGGLRTMDGRTVRWNTLFRCGDMGQLSGQDLQIIGRLNIKDVVDFRNDSEIEKSPDRYPKEYAMNRIHTPIGTSDGKDMAKFMQVVMDPSATASSVENIFAGFYEAMALGAKDYQPLFDELLENGYGEALLFHCTAGKDRTGLASALILSALNVPEQTIIDEYTLSNRYTVDAFMKNPMMKGIKPEIAEALAGVKPQYIQASLHAIKEKYGSVAAMLERELGLDRAKIQSLVDKYTY
ncbi:protein-tyrosine phosphatase [Dyadobacter jejuensis]|uniref:Protein-tyrosine phosphatase n=1 Tax=Dyadobacter jejuensis TaxID=1082580 RepID=A0A316API1_9BACT|nr:tyrosine-protein phosphatase [Dyadobacter jejuensis]PWJ59189.1 protein-tyrosine phosphatase [Dyadobacter jejuensis]